MRRALVVAVLAAGAAAAAVLAVALPSGSEATDFPQLAGRPVVATATVEPRAHLFGDAVTARVEAVVDRGRVDPSALRLQADFSPYEPVGPVVVRRRDVGNLARVRLTVPLRCLGGECVPPAARRLFTFRAGALVAGQRPVAQLQWPEVEVTSRVSQSALVDSEAIIQVHWRANMTELPPVSYRVEPGVAVAAFGGLAGLLAAAGALLAFVALRPPPRTPPPLPPLERALVLLEAARRADAEEQRRALDLVAAELARSGAGDLAATASTLAWSRPLPAERETEELTERVAELVHGRRNGDRA